MNMNVSSFIIFESVEAASTLNQNANQSDTELWDTIENHTGLTRNKKKNLDLESLISMLVSPRTPINGAVTDCQREKKTTTHCRGGVFPASHAIYLPHLIWISVRLIWPCMT